MGGIGIIYWIRCRLLIYRPGILWIYSIGVLAGASRILFRYDMRCRRSPAVF